MGRSLELDTRVLKLTELVFFIIYIYSSKYVYVYYEKPKLIHFICKIHKVIEHNMCVSKAN
jgi:hypothetical protein